MLAVAGQLEDRRRSTLRDDATRRHGTPDRTSPTAAVEENEVERKAHAEGMDAGAPGDQQSHPDLLAIQMGQAEQARAEPFCHRHLAAADAVQRQRPEPGRESLLLHELSRDKPANLFPAALANRANPRSEVVPRRHGTTMTGMIQNLLSLGLRQRMGFNSMNKKTTRRGNYESGSDYVLEYGELRFAFNEEDFGQRVEQAAVKLGFVQQGLSQEELNDLLDLAVNGEISEPASRLGEHINENWEDLVGPSNRSLVHWLRRLVFRGAWLDQRVKEGELDVVFDESTQSFGYVQPDRSNELIELSKEPSWRRIAYRR